MHAIWDIVTEVEYSKLRDLSGNVGAYRVHYNLYAFLAQVQEMNT
jgi:hypothetical protein